MSLKSDSLSFGGLARCLHWAVALLIVVLIVSGELADDVKVVIPPHKAIGVLVFFLASSRLVWWLLDLTRPGDDELGWEKWPSRLVKWGLAALSVAMPLSGWLMSSAAQKPIVFFGLFQVPFLIDGNKELAHLFKESHEALASVLIVLLAAHVAGALRHHFLLKDNVLTRMLPCLGKCGGSCGGHKQEG